MAIVFPGDLPKKVSIRTSFHIHDSSIREGKGKIAC